MTYPIKGNKSSGENVGCFYLKAGSKAFKEMFDNARDAMMAKYGNDTVHCYVNRSACEMTGYTFGELMNMEFKDIVYPEDFGNIEKQSEKQRKDMDLSCYFKTRIVTKKGEVIPVEMTVTFGRGEKNGLSFVILRDIRKAKHFEN